MGFLFPNLYPKATGEVADAVAAIKTSLWPQKSPVGSADSSHTFHTCYLLPNWGTCQKGFLWLQEHGYLVDPGFPATTPGGAPGAPPGTPLTQGGTEVDV